MARGSIDQKFIQEINKHSFFGSCNPNDLVTADTERKEKKKRASIDRKKRFQDNRQLKMERQKQEEQDHLFACQEQEEFDKNLSERNCFTSGRGMVILENRQKTNPLPRGRGPVLKEDGDKLDPNLFFKKELQIKHQIYMANGTENYNSNVKQKQYWHGEQTPPLEEFSCGFPGTSSPDNFDNAVSVSSSFPNSPIESLKSCSSTSHSSPAPEVFPTQPDTPAVSTALGAVRKRSSRIAAKFSNVSMDKDSDEHNNNNKHSEVYMSAQQSIAPFGMREDHHPASGISFNSLNPSLRVLDDDILSQRELFNSYNISAASFKYKREDFPPLK